MNSSLDRSWTHQDGQHNVLEVILQVSGVGAEENKVALYQLQKAEIKRSGVCNCPVLSAPLRWVSNEDTGVSADSCFAAIYSHPRFMCMTADNSIEVRGKHTETDAKKRGRESDMI